MNVLIIPEDQPHDRYLLEPLFRRLFARLRQPNAKIRVCPEPRLQGKDDALNMDTLWEIVSKYSAMVDCFILCVDRDGNLNRRAALDERERLFADRTIFIAENAWEEIETWTLAGLRNLPKEWSWAAIRSEISVKEKYFDDLARRRGLAGPRDGGRKVLGLEAARNIPAIRRKCPEDFGRLAKRIEAAIAAS